MNHIELLKVLFTGLRSPPVVGGPGGCFWGDHRSKGIGGAVGGCCSNGEVQEGCYAERSNVQREDDATPSNPAEVVFLCAWVPIRFTHSAVEPAALASTYSRFVIRFSIF